jgi:hypothetical protein
VHLKTIQNHMFKQHNLDKNGKHQDEAKLSKILIIIIEHLYDDQSISVQTRSDKGIAQYTLKKRLRDSSRQTIAEAMDTGDKIFRKLHHKVRETQQE